VYGYRRDLCGGGLEDHFVGTLSERNTEFEELGDDSREVLEEKFLILGVLVDVCLKGLIGYEGHVGGQHHEGLGGLVLVLSLC
jgi:hypothetical protein